jgi:hypothetical protein
VLTVNTRAQALYQRLGMTEVARHGPGQHQDRCAVRPAPPERPPRHMNTSLNKAL